MKIGVVLGSIREGRNGLSVAQWVVDAVKAHHDDVELIDLAEFDVPLLKSATLPAMANKQYDDENVTRWSQAIDACDAYIFVTPEYNHGVPGAFKNAVDTLGPEWQNKTAGLVSYGADGGVRAVEQWRQILANFSMHVVRAQVSLNLFTEFGEQGLVPSERRDVELKALVDQVSDMAARRA